MTARRAGAITLTWWSSALALGAGSFVLAGDPYALLFLPFMTIGAVLAWRRPGNAVGWLMCLFSSLGALNTFATAYAVHGLLTRPGSLPGAAVAGWVQTWLWLAYVGVLGTIFLVFPDGVLPSRRWRPVLWALWALVGATAIASAFYTAQLNPDRFPGQVNAYAIAPLWEVYPPFIPGVFVALTAAAASLIARSRRARGVEQLQLKWVGYAAALFTVSAVAGQAIGALGLIEPKSALANVAFLVTFLTIPLAIAVAILRYRLYDIDLLINRTLVYGAVSAVLAATYFGAVIVIQAVLRPFTSGSELAVAASTLLVVALFQPLRRRVQDAVDRRFYRSRYDAARTLDAFGMRLRDEVDLDEVRADLLRVVADTLRPAHASVWLRQSDR